MVNPLKAEGIWFRYNTEWILRGVDLEVATGELLGIAGPNASGKTTLLRVLQGLFHPQEGKVWVCGMEMTKLKRREVARLMAVVPQVTAIPLGFSVLETVLMGRNPHLRPLEFEGPDDLRIAMECLEITGCHHLWDRKIEQLSGGETQRVLLARALAQQTPILILDEPTAHLDLKYQIEFAWLLTRLNAERNITVIWVSHDLNLASLVCHRIVLLADGSCRYCGPPQEVVTARNVEEVFGAKVIVDAHPQTGTPRVTPAVGVVPRRHKND